MKQVKKLEKELKPIIETIREGYIVGGTVRDTVLGIFSAKDIDIAVEKIDEILIKNIENFFGKKGFTFKKEKKVFSVITNRFKLDVAETEENIETDLLLRDFTINAIAIPFKDGKPLNSFIDPTNGIKDIKERLIKPISEKNIKKDPVRIIRGIRLKNLLDFNYTENFTRCTAKYKDMLKNSPKERIKDELIKILNLKTVEKCIKELTEFEVIFTLIPELELQKKIPPSGVHQFPLLEHTLKTVENVTKILDKNSVNLEKNLIKEVKNLKLHGNLTGRELLILAAMLHDIGKPFTVKEKNGKLTFYNHDKVGARIAKNIVTSLSFGSKSAKITEKIIELHLRPLFLYKLSKEKKLTLKAVYNFLKDSKELFPFIVIHSIADFKATSEKFDTESEKYVNFINTLFPKYINYKLMKPLLTGKEIMEVLNIEKPSKTVGKIKEKLSELQFTKKVKSKDDAVKAVKGFTL